MPTTRRRIARKRTVSVEAWQVEFVLYGKVLRPDGGPSCKPYLWRPEFDGCFARSNAAKELWESIRNQELPRWVKEHPGSRPSAWWEFDASEPRPRGESEAAYLERHDLLSPAERRALSAS